MISGISIAFSPEAKATIARLGFTPELAKFLAQGMDIENQKTVDAIKAKISGSPQKGLRGSQVLHRRTGRLRDSIGRSYAIVARSGNAFSISGSVGSGVGQGAEPVKYAAIHEFGGVINYPSRPTRSTGRYGRKHPQTQAYSVTMPNRSYIRSTVRERQSAYSARLSRRCLNYWAKGDGNV
jgi:phage gpG-like protein